MLNFFKNSPLKNDIESEMSPYDSHALKWLLNKFERNNLNILEIGSWSGKGSTAIFSAYAERIVCVDHWQGNENDTHRLLAKTISPFEVFKNNTHYFAEKIVAVHTNSNNISGLFAPGTFDMIFIDGDHRYNQIKADILNTIHLVRRGGIICGHDCEGFPTLANRELLMANSSQDHCDSIFINFKEMHPGVILAVDEFVDDVSLFAQERFNLTIDGKEHSGCSSIWYKWMS